MTTIEAEAQVPVREGCTAIVSQRSSRRCGTDPRGRPARPTARLVLDLDVAEPRVRDGRHRRCGVPRSQHRPNPPARAATAGLIDQPACPGRLRLDGRRFDLSPRDLNLEVDRTSIRPVASDSTERLRNDAVSTSTAGRPSLEAPSANRTSLRRTTRSANRVGRPANATLFTAARVSGPTVATTRTASALTASTRTVGRGRRCRRMCPRARRRETISTLSAGTTVETALAEITLRRRVRVRMTNRVVTCGSASRISSSTTP